MIVTEIYDGQGLGNQLWCYVVTRAIALDKGYDFGIMHPERFKCLDFMDLDFGLPVIGGSGPEGGIPRTLPEGIEHYYRERQILHPATGADIRLYDTNLTEIPDNTKIDGLMQSEDYIESRKDEIREWLKVTDGFECLDYSDENTCIINFRGGEYVRHQELFLKKEYWDHAVRHMLRLNKNLRFIVITDDVYTAKKFFPDYDAFHFDIAKDYSIIKNAKYLILSNSSFAWFSAWLNEDLRFCIAPKYWARHNVSDGYWSLGYNLTKGWMYQDRKGYLYDYETCKNERDEYIQRHPEYFTVPRIKKNFLVVSNYYNDICWVPQYTDDYLIYDQSATPILSPFIDRSKVVPSYHAGHNIRDYCTFIIEHYESLPDVTIFVTGNIFPRHVTQPWFNTIVNNDYFTPIEEPGRHKHRPPAEILSEDGGYHQINNSWYLRHRKNKYFYNYNDFLRFSFVDPVIPKYNRFAPGSNYILTRENILKLPKVFYENVRFLVSHTPDYVPGEAYIMEQLFYRMWHDDMTVSEQMLRPLGESFVGFPRRRASFMELIIQKTPLKAAGIYNSLIAIIKGKKKIDVQGSVPQKYKNLAKRLLAGMHKVILRIKQPLEDFRSKKRHSEWKQRIN